MKTQSILSIVLFGLLVSSSIALRLSSSVFTIASASHTCTNKEKNAKSCPLEYNPVCASNNKGKQTSYGSPCIACSLKNIVSHTAGPCKPVKKIDNPEHHTCTPDEKKTTSCGVDFRPVCGKITNGQQNFANPCSACIVGPAWIDGECSKQTAATFAADTPATSTPATSTPTGIVGATAPPATTTTTAPPATTTTTAPAATTTTTAPATTTTSSAPHTCTTKEKQSTACALLEYAPVCGSDSKGNKQSFGSACVACAVSQIVSHVPGPCAAPTVVPSPKTTKCSASDKSKGSCPVTYTPACGKDTAGNTASYSNGCVACLAPNADTWTENECTSSAAAAQQTSTPVTAPAATTTTTPATTPAATSTPAASSAKHSCSTQEKKATACTLTEYAPVCGSDSKGNKQSFGSGCVACAVSQISDYVPGVCATVPVVANPKSHTCSLTDKSAKSCTVTMTPVCGKTSKGVKSSFANGCVACLGTDIQSWTENECTPSVVASAAQTTPAPVTTTAAPPASTPAATTTTTTTTAPAPAAKPTATAPAASTPAATNTQSITQTTAPAATAPATTAASTPATAASDKLVSDMASQVKPAATQAATATPQGKACTAAEKSVEGCSAQYAPVCGYNSDGSSDNYINQCVACADQDVVSHVDGTCGPLAAIANPTTHTCASNERDSSKCTFEFKPVCAAVGTQGVLSMGNPCLACSIGQITSWTDGQC